MPKTRVATVADQAPCCGPVATGTLDESGAQVLAGGFAALADPVRLRLLNILATAEAGEVCVCDLTTPVGRSQPTVSHHLRILTEAGLVAGDKRGRWVWYRIQPDRLAALGAALGVG
jgi:ArsR family transcriptional regulator, arsenate/arsenite/antimonite-responsive transcriptional repressor